MLPLASAMDWLLRFLPFEQLVTVVDAAMPVSLSIALFIIILGTVPDIPKHQADGIGNMVVRGIIVLAMIAWCSATGDRSLIVKLEQLAKNGTQAIIDLAAGATDNAPITVVPEKHIPLTDSNGNPAGELDTQGHFYQYYQTVPAVTMQPADASWFINKNPNKSQDPQNPNKKPDPLYVKSSALLYDFSTPFAMFEQFITDSQDQNTLTDAQKTDLTIAGAGLGAAKGGLAGLKKGGFVGVLIGGLLGGIVGGTAADQAANAISPEKIVLFIISIVANICMFVMELVLIIQKFILVFDKWLVPPLLALLVWQGPVRFVGVNGIQSVIAVACWPFGLAFVHMGTMAGFSQLYTIQFDSSLSTLLIMLCSFLLIALWMIIGTLATPALINQLIQSGANLGAGLVGGAAGRAAHAVGKAAGTAAAAGGATAGMAAGGVLGGSAGAQLGANLGGSAGASIGGMASSLGSNTSSAIFQATGSSGGGGAVPTRASSAAGMAALQGLSQMGQGGGAYGGGGTP